MADFASEAPAARVHGGIDERALRALQIEPSSVLDFSVNLNPYGPCRPVLQAARSAPLDRYPDASACAARTAWAQQLGCQADELAVGHGAADLFWAIARAAIAPGDEVVIAEPTFSEFRIAAAASGARVTRVCASIARDLTLDLAALAHASAGARALYLCSPNNPTGEYFEHARVEALANALPDTLVVLDQSFLGLSDHADAVHTRLPGNVVCVRSLTKEFACPGLRIGLCLASAAWIDRIEAMRPTWATSSPALAALEQSARETAFVQESWQRMRADRDATALLLQERGLSPRATATSYQLVPVPGLAADFCLRMLRHGVLLRDGTSFGLPGHVRIAALPPAQRAVLSAALDAVLSA
ncbi:MAG: putative Histidinol-phosphate transaminase [Myxococcaceae bacterium]|nr:putative Histidinol-phosphate transaminase [Myxococcaceae bacterium]